MTVLTALAFLPTPSVAGTKRNWAEEEELNVDDAEDASSPVVLVIGSWFTMAIVSISTAFFVLLLVLCIWLTISVMKHRKKNMVNQYELTMTKAIDCDVDLDEKQQLKE